MLRAFVALLAAAGVWQTSPLPFTLATGETARKHLPATMPGGIAVFDFDGDGLLDIYLPNGASLPSGRKSSAQQSNRLLRNLGGMRFEDRTTQANLAGSEYDFAAIAGDYDQDGWTDLLVCGLRSVTLYRNRGNGTFTDVTHQSRIDNRGRWSAGGAWLDYDRDGDLDLFVVNYVQWDPAKEPPCKVDGVSDFCHPRYYEPEANALFRNDGGGRFTDVSEASGIATHKGKGMAATVADFDLDGNADIFVTNDRVLNYLFRNLGGGRFEERALEMGVAAPSSGNPPSSMGADAQDFDNDGRADLIYTALRDETFPLARNRGNDFEDAGLRTKLDLLTRPMAGWGIVFADLDNDGWKDIAAARSDVLSAQGPRGASAREPLSWFRNVNGKQFVTGAALPVPADMYRGLVAADFDNDGCLDLVATALNASARVLRNGCGGNWLKVDVRAAGARVRAGSQWRHVSSTIGYASSCECPLHFGLGPAPTVDVEVLFSGGATKRIEGVKANQVLVVKP
ncbi:MAG: CRTAC1 family protein [Bryobacterales bacterium]|nr:CRTAC1 family protein [Bryobacterales bacterium]